MRDDALAFVFLLVLVLSVCAFAIANALESGRCQSACWLSGWSYVATGTSVCECADDGVPMTTAIPREPTP